MKVFELIVLISASFTLAMAGVNVFIVLPDKYKRGTISLFELVLFGVLGTAINLIVCGRVLGWW